MGAGSYDFFPVLSVRWLEITTETTRTAAWAAASLGKGEPLVMRYIFPEGDVSFIVIVVLICVELLKVLIVPNPFDVLLLAGLILVLVLTARP